MPGWQDMLDEEAHGMAQPGQKLRPQGAQGMQAQQPAPDASTLAPGQAMRLTPEQTASAKAIRNAPMQKMPAVYGGSFNAAAKRPSSFMGFAQYAGLAADELDRLEKQATSRTFAAQQKAGRALDEASAQMGAGGYAGASLDARDHRANPNANGYLFSSYGDYVKAQQEANTALQRQQQTAAGGSWRSRALRGVGGYQAAPSDTDFAAQDTARRGAARQAGAAQADETTRRQQAETRARREAEWNAGQGARNAQELQAAEAELEAADMAQRMAPATGSGVRSIIHPEEYTDIGYTGGLEDTPQNRRWLDAQRRVARARQGGTKQPYQRPQYNSDL